MRDRRPQLETVDGAVWRRGVAMAVDTAVTVTVSLALGAAIAVVSGQPPVPVVAALVVVLGAVYTVYFEGTYGQTPGKRVMGIAVVKTDGRACDAPAALVRNLLRPLDLFPGVYLVGLTSIAATDRRQRIGDLAAGTVVVRVAALSPPDSTRRLVGSRGRGPIGRGPTG